MDRKQAWSHYFTTGDREPLVKAYWDSIHYLAWSKYPTQTEDMFQVGMIGLLKAINKIDPKRVKSKDAWVWLNVKSEMICTHGVPTNRNVPSALRKHHIKLDTPLTLSLNHPISDADDNTFLESLRVDDETDFDLLLKDLPARQRLILSLIYRHDWHKTEIARLLNISSMRVGQIEQQALTKLRTSIPSL